MPDHNPFYGHRLLMSRKHGINGFHFKGFKGDCA
jgi:hypothetical protein